MSDEKSIFRAASLERLNTPEQLDVMVEVTQPRGWMVLIMIGIVLVILLLWGFIGSIPTRVSGTGILIRSGGLTQVVSTNSGQLQEVLPDVGETVKQGQIVARINSPDQINKLQNMEIDLEEMRLRHAKLTDYYKQKIAHQRESLTKIKKVNIGQQLASLEDRRKFLAEEVRKQEIILQRGLIVPRDLNNTQSQLNTTIDQINGLKLKIVEEEDALFNLQKEAESELLKSSNNIDQFVRELRRQESQLALESLIKSPVSGRVVEVRARAGNFIRNGDPLVILEDARQKMEALVYINSADGKKVKEGMEIDISPTTVKREEFGAILGLVTHVSRFPTSPDMIGQTIPNKTLVETLLAQGVPLEIRADLIPDPHTVSGYKWTSSEGPRTDIQVGTMVNCSVRVRERRPITLVMPFLKKLFGVE